MSLALFQALARLDDTLDDPLRIRRWAGGACNRVFRLDTAARTLALRLNQTDSGRLGVDRRREADILKALRGRAWAPEAVSVSDDWLLTTWVEGSPASEGPDADLDWLARALAEVHSMAPDVAPLNMADQIRHLMAQGPRLDPEIESALLGHCDAYRLPERLTLCHHDWHPGNVILGSNGWVLLDWEFAALGDPVMDVAAACQGFQLDADQCRRLARTLGLDEYRFRQVQCLMAAVALVWYRANPESVPGDPPDAGDWYRRWKSIRF